MESVDGQHDDISLEELEAANVQNDPQEEKGLMGMGFMVRAMQKKKGPSKK